MGVFLDSMIAELDEDALESREHGVLEAGSDCNGEPTVWRIARFRVDPDVALVEIYDTDLESVQFNQDREAFTIARVPIDAEIPPPEDVALEQLDETTGGGAATSSDGPILIDPDDGTGTEGDDTGAEGDDTGTGTEGDDTGSSTEGDTGAGADTDPAADPDAGAG